MKELKPKLLFKYDEYTHNWNNLMKEYYSRFFETITKDDVENFEEFQVNVSIFIPSTVFAMMSNQARFKESIIDALEEDIHELYFKSIFDESQINFNQWKEYYNQQTVIYRGVLKMSAQSYDLNVQTQGLAKMLVNRAEVNDAREFTQIEELSKLIQDMIQVFTKFSVNSGVSAKLFGKPDFVVLKD